jgi:class 3 adenylate cyclase/predicted ATPase
VQTIAEWLASLGLSEYAQRFAENYVDPSVLSDLTDEDLRDLNVPLGHRKMMLRAITKLQRPDANKRQMAAEPAGRDGPEKSTVGTISEWLTSLGLPEYAQRFAENYVDLGVLPDLTDQDLKDLRVPLGHRKMMLRAITELKGARGNKRQKAAEAAGRDHAERRQLTLMFCDLVGSTALSARLDPEDMRQVLALFHRCIAEVISGYQGTVARYMGDGVLAYFGYPQAHEDDAEQAVRAGLALVDAIPRLRTGGDVALQVRVGIATGIVVVGDLLSSAGAEEQEVVGETPNLAARLQALAEPGTVLICAQTRQLVGGHFECRDLGVVALKGWTESIPAWQALGTSGILSRFEARHRTMVLPPLVGREEEMALLLRRWRYAIQGEGRVVVLTGEPGIGKSHIALTLAERLKSEPHISLRYFCSIHHANSALFPFIGQLERAARFTHGDSPAEKLGKLETVLVPSTVDRTQTIALLANLLSLPPSDRCRLPEMSPQSRKEKTLAALLAQLEGLAARQPVLVIFEDVHWMDPTSLELLTVTVERVAELRVLLLITARPHFVQPWLDYAHVTTIALARLGRPEGAAIIERVTERKALPEEVMNQILTRTDGVPLFIEELTKAVVESGLLREQDGHYVLEHPLPSLAIPTTLHASLTARLDRLAPVREVAQIGAVVGREFSYKLLNAVSGLPQEKLEEALEQLVRSELIFRRGEIPQAVYTFKHALVRDAAYSSLLKVRRAQLHTVIASALEQQFPEIVEGQPETLAHHLTEAGLVEKAVGYWLRAGKNASHRFANLEAIAHLKRGIETVGHLLEGSERDRLELDLQFALGPCLIATQGPASSTAIATFARGRELCARLENAPEYLQIMFWLATGSVIRGELPQAREVTATLRDLAEARKDRPMLINAIRGLGMILLFMGNVVDARGLTERAVEVFTASSEEEKVAARAAGQDAGAAALALMSWALWVLGHVDTAVARMDAALERADVVGHPHTRAYVSYYASILHALRSEPVIAHQYAERCLALSEQHGFRHWHGLSRAIRGICVTMLDPSAASLEEVRSALNQYRGAGYQLGITALYVLLGPALLLRNEPEAALEMIEQGLSTASHNSERIFEAELHRLQAQALLARGAPDARSQAKSLLDQALTTARNQQARSLELRATKDLAALSIDHGRRDEVLDSLASIYSWFIEGLDTQDLKEAKTLLDQLRACSDAA